MFDIVVCKETQSNKAEICTVFNGKIFNKRYYTLTMELVDGSRIRARSKAIFFPLQICK
jgi:hypothetical protein